FGSASVYFDNATILGESATFEVDLSFGNVTLYVPCQFPLLKDEIDRYKKAGSTVILQASSLAALHSLHKTLQEYDIQVEYINDKEIHKNSVQLIQGN
ncbi:hypothetical protein, partial [Streptococcus gordonii]|uniref:hypothetical protein n=1 Tax=Streptococcus gordonii TaxID=1302 RepID=UPI0030C85FC4